MSGAAPPAAAAPGPFQAAWNGVKGTPGYNSKYKNAGDMNTRTKEWNTYLAGLKAKAVPLPLPASLDPKVVAAAALATAKAAKPTTKVEAEAAAKTASEAADTVKGDPLEEELKAEATRIRALIASLPLTGGRRRKSRASKKAKKATRKTKKSKRSRKSKGRK
jgi:hypothetical protein